MRDADGKVIIKMSLDTKQLDKSLKEEERNLKKYSDDAKELTQLKSKYEADISAYEKERKSAEKLRKELKEIRKEYEAIDKKIQEIYDTPYEEEIQRRLAENPGIIKQRNAILEQYNAKKGELFSLNNPLSIGVSAEIEKEKELLNDVNAKLSETTQLQGITEQKIKNITANLQRGQILQGIQNIGKGLTNVIKKVTKWGLAIFGIRGAYMAVRNAINVISQDDAQLKADIDYMKNAMAYTLEPIVRTIVNLAKELMYAIQYIVYLLSGKNIFANANKSLEKANKSAKALSKTLQPFDEMNIMQDTSSGDGNAEPSINLAQMNELSKTGQGLVGIIGAIAGALALLKLSELLEKLGLISNALGFKEAFGIGLILLSLYNIIIDIIDIWNKFDETVEGNNTTLRDWGDVVEWIGVGIAGLGFLILGMPGIIAGVIVTIIGLIMKNWDTIKAFFTDKVFGWLDKMIEKLNKTTLGKFFATFFEEAKRVIGDVINVFDGLFKSIKQIFDGIILIAKGKLGDGLKSIGKGIVNALITMINFLVSGLNTLVAPFRAIIVGMGKIAGKNWSMENIKFPSIKYLAKGGIINMPGKGVPLGGGLARGGEVAPEGVIPLTDSQQMDLLGASIGKHTTINATIPVYVANRLVMREFKRINAEDNFAYNR